MGGDANPWRVALTPDELQALQETEAAILVPPPSKGAWARWGEEKLSRLVERVPESVRSQLTQAVAGALDKMRLGSTYLVSAETVYARLSRYGHPIRRAEDILALPIACVDDVARDLADHATAGLTIEGAVAGTAGLLGLVADIPILYGTLFKTMQEVSLCYGFAVEPPHERIHLLQVLDVGHNLHHPGRIDMVGVAFRLQSMIRAGFSAEQLEDFSARSLSGAGVNNQALMRNLRLARQLALDLLERKLLQGLVIVGSAVGAAANYQLARDVGLASFHLYRRRFLMERALRRCS